MPFIKIKPAIPTNIVRHPNNMRLLKAEGEEVDHNSYWERRLKDGDVILIDTLSTNVETGLRPVSTTTEEIKKSKNKTEDNN